jgi:peptide deformylase
VTLRSILHHPDPRLRAICAPVETFDADLGALADDMLETMYAAPGRGLAAPQIGVLVRLFVMDADWKTGTPAPKVIVNPRLLAVSEDRVMIEEGCLSIPGVPCPVERPAALRLAWQRPDGSAEEADFEGVAARVILHEMDHLDGILCIDRVALPVRTDPA